MPYTIILKCPETNVILKHSYYYSTGAVPHPHYVASPCSLLILTLIQEQIETPELPYCKLDWHRSVQTRGPSTHFRYVALSTLPNMQDIRLLWMASNLQQCGMPILCILVWRIQSCRAYIYKFICNNCRCGTLSTCGTREDK